MLVLALQFSKGWMGPRPRRGRRTRGGYLVAHQGRVVQARDARSIVVRRPRALPRCPWGWTRTRRQAARLRAGVRCSLKTEQWRQAIRGPVVPPNSGKPGGGVGRCPDGQL